MKTLSWGGLCLSTFILLFFPSAVAETQDSLSDAIEVHRDISYVPGGDAAQTLDLYLPKAGTGPIPVVLWVHGGGWEEGSKANPPLLLLMRFGYGIASINYRLSQQAIFPAQIYDCKAAVRWLRANAAKYNLNPDKIGAAGASAGGHLVALLGTTADNKDLEGDEGNLSVSSRVQAACDFYGPTNFLDMTALHDIPANSYPARVVGQLLGGPVEQNEAKARAASPFFYVTSQACPFFIAHGDRDPIVPLQQSIQLNDALQKAGVASTLAVVKGGGHGFYDPAVMQGVTDFFRRYL